MSPVTPRSSLRDDLPFEPDVNLPGDCPKADKDWVCILPDGHSGDHVLGNKYNFRESRTVPRSQDEICDHTWTNLRCTLQLGHEGPCAMSYDFNYKKETDLTPVALPASTTTEKPAFPFTLEDLDYWVVKRKDGIITKYVVTSERSYHKDHPQKIGEVRSYPAGASGTGTTTAVSYFSDICSHNGDVEVWTSEKLQLSVANCGGLRKFYKNFDTVIDCGQILNMDAIRNSRLLQGEDWLVAELEQHSLDYMPNILRIDWDDREAPLLDPAFWPALVKLLNGKVVTACQGGHGRSGSSAVCMLMVLAKDYTPYDAVCHLRALHCGRAIESKAQHDYLGEVGTFLKRENDIAKVGEVKDFRAAFLKINKASAKPYQEILSNKAVKK